MLVLHFRVNFPFPVSFNTKSSAHSGLSSGTSITRVPFARLLGVTVTDCSTVLVFAMLPVPFKTKAAFLFATKSLQLNFPFSVDSSSSKVLVCKFRLPKEEVFNVTESKSETLIFPPETFWNIKLPVPVEFGYLVNKSLRLPKSMLSKVTVTPSPMYVSFHVVSVLFSVPEPLIVIFSKNE